MCPGFYEFDIFERGKPRHIKSTTINERVVQRCLCDYALVPALERTFIYDNGASMKNKGYDFAINRLVKHLRKYYRKYGNEGYILTYDFSKFFDNVSHALVKIMVAKEIADDWIRKLTFHFIDAFGDVGLGLGSQISQVLALASGNKLDHSCKEIDRIRLYGRYMDDGYLISRSKEKLQNCLVHIKAICDMLEIKLNTKKTQISKLKKFSWLKVRFYLTSTGKVVKKIYKRSITKERQKLKKLKKKLDAGLMTYKDICQSLQCWVSYARKFDAFHARANMIRLFKQIFYKEIKLYGIPKNIYAGHKISRRGEVRRTSLYLMARAS